MLRIFKKLFFVAVSFTATLQIMLAQNSTQSYDVNRELIINELLLHARSKLGCQYEWAASGPDKFDCSGLVQYAFKQVGYEISRTSLTQSKEGDYVMITLIRKGDLVFFKSADSEDGSISHVGIAITDFSNGDFKFIHAASKYKQVVISNFSDDNYMNTYIAARRIIGDTN